MVLDRTALRRNMVLGRNMVLDPTVVLDSADRPARGIGVAGQIRGTRTWVSIQANTSVATAVSTRSATMTR